MDPQQQSSSSSLEEQSESVGVSKEEPGRTPSHEPQGSSAPSPPTPASVITPNQRRMITTAGQIREVESEESPEHYESNEYHHQIVEAPTQYTYESPGADPGGRHIDSAPTAARLTTVEKQNGHVVAHHTQTVYVVQRDEAPPEMLRYHPPPPPPIPPNMARTYEEARFQARYHHQYQPAAAQHQQSVKSELEGHPSAAGQSQQQQQIIYETEAQDVQNDGPDTKTQYTNLEPMQNLSSSYYLTSAGYSSGNVAYVQGPSSKEEYYTLHSGSPNPVLYKSKF